MTGDDDLAARLQFVLEIDALKTVLRRNPVNRGERRENTAEHSWHLAVMALVLAPHADAPIDVGRVITMLLVHDLVEIDAGDTFAYDDDGNATKAAREQAASDVEISYAAAGASVLIACDRIVRWTWFLLLPALYLAVIGVPVEIVGAALAFVGTLVIICLPLLGLGSRVAISLLDRAGALADLESVRVSHQPRALADLLLRVLDDGHRVRTPWQVAHLWFERDGKRAAIAVDLAHGDSRLRARLQRAEHSAR